MGGVVDRRSSLALAVTLAVSAATAWPDEGTPARPGRVHLLAYGKPLVVDPPWRQALGADAVRRVAEALRSTADACEVDALAEDVLTREELLSGARTPRLSGAAFEERLAALARTASPEDTVVVYTHTHGRKAGFEAAQPEGGLVLDLPHLVPAHQGTTLWSEYAELLLRLPARHVIVGVMCCFSGGLVDHLQRPEVAPRWRDRAAQGRSFVVLTSQDAARPSNPIVKDGARVNPFTYALERALRGDADGFALDEGRPRRGPADGSLTIGELVDYTLHTTRTVASEVGRNDAAPMVAASFDRAQALAFGGAPRR